MSSVSSAAPASSLLTKRTVFTKNIDRWVMAAVLLMLGLMEVQLIFSVRWQSPTLDEGDHLYAGYMSLIRHDYTLNPEHPPMAKMVAALPLVFLDLKTPPRGHLYFKEVAYLGGREFLFRNGPLNGGKYTADTLLFHARMAASIFALLLAALVFLAGSEMFGRGTGLLAMALVVFEPTILTNGAYVTTDAAISCMLFAAVYAFYRYVKRPTILRLAVAGIASGLALAAKHSAILLLPMLIVLGLRELVLRWRSAADSSNSDCSLNSQRPSIRREVLHMAGAISGISIIAIVVLWAFYGFHYAMGPILPTLPEAINRLPPFDAAGIHFFARLHLLPESYLFGLVDVRKVSNTVPAFLLGKIYTHGVWFYFPIALAIKCTLGEMLLLAIAVWMAASGKIRQPREVFFLLSPAAVYLAVAMTTRLDIGIRHVLPIFAFLLVFAAAGAVKLAGRSRAGGIAIAVLLLWHVCSSVRCFPNYMPYANELWGGPSQIHRYLSDSSSEWGQQLKAVKAYLDANHVRQCWFAYWLAPAALLSYYGIPCHLLPVSSTVDKFDLDVPESIEGPVLISYSELYGTGFLTSARDPYKALVDRKPDAVIMNGVAVYNGTFQFPLASALEYVYNAKRAMMGRNPQAALVNATLAEKIAPGYFDTELDMGVALLMNGSPSEAMEHLRRAAEITRNMEPSAQKEVIPLLLTLMRESRMQEIMSRSSPGYGKGEGQIAPPGAPETAQHHTNRNVTGDNRN